MPPMPAAPRSGPRVLIIVPAWNEQESIGSTVAEIRSAVPDADLLVVDDGSADQTRARAEEAGATVCSLPFNLGVAVAGTHGATHAQVEGEAADGRAGLLRAGPGLSLIHI